MAVHDSLNSARDCATTDHAYPYASSEQDAESTAKQKKAEISDDETKVAEQTTEEEAETREQEAENGGDSEDDGAEKLTAGPQ